MIKVSGITKLITFDTVKIGMAFMINNRLYIKTCSGKDPSICDAVVFNENDSKFSSTYINLETEVKPVDLDITVI